MSGIDQQRDETALGYELDTITLRDIAAVRYVRHHEWLDHVIGSVIPTDRVAAPKIEAAMDEKQLEMELERIKNEIAALKEDKANGWGLDVNEEKTKVLTRELLTLREEFGENTADSSLERVEKALNAKIVSVELMNPVKITYDREKEEAESRLAAEAATAAGESAAEISDAAPAQGSDDVEMGQ